MKRKKQKTAPPPCPGAPEGTVWFGGPVDETSATLRIFGEDLDPDEISSLLRALPTESEARGDLLPGRQQHRVARISRWALDSSLTPDHDLDRHIADIFARLTDDLSVWKSLASRYSVDMFCGLFLDAENRGTEISVATARLLAQREVKLSLDIYGPEGHG